MPLQMSWMTSQGEHIFKPHMLKSKNTIFVELSYGVGPHRMFLRKASTQFPLALPCVPSSATSLSQMHQHKQSFRFSGMGSDMAVKQKQKLTNFTTLSPVRFVWHKNHEGISWTKPKKVSEALKNWEEASVNAKDEQRERYHCQYMVGLLDKKRILGVLRAYRIISRMTS